MSEQKVRNGRQLRPGQRTEVWVVEPETGRLDRVLSTTDILLEAPNWHDSGALIVNGNGQLWRLDPNDGSLTGIALDGVPPLNNDHLLHPDGETVLISANDGQLYRAPLAGGPGVRITDDPGRSHFLHGVSPDGSELAYVELPRGDFGSPGRLALLPTDGGERRLLDVGLGHCDGPEYTPDGEWLLLNSESFTEQPGHAQLARIRRDGSGFERLLASDRVDWFPHAAPTGRLACYLSFPSGTLGHPADHAVELRTVSTDDWTTPVFELAFFGGQGTINVNSWAPDGRRFAFVSYPIDDQPETHGMTETHHAR